MTAALNRPQLDAADPASSVWVGASAGTGKTKVLTDRMLRLLLAGTPPERILAITFTKAAAAEMANRLRSQLARWATMPETALAGELQILTGEPPDGALLTRARRLFARIVDLPDGMAIQTIHAFCQSLLRRFPLEAGLPPHFEPMDDRMQAALMAEVIEELLAAPTSDIAPSLGHLAALVNELQFGELMHSLTMERGRLDRLLRRRGGIATVLKALRRQLDLPEHESEASLLEAACRDDAFDAPLLRRAADTLARGAKTYKGRSETILAWLGQPPPGRASGIASYRSAFLTKEWAPFASMGPPATDPALLAGLGAEAARLIALADRCRNARTHDASAALLTVGAGLVKAYRDAKHRRGLVDYEDLILETAGLLTRPDYAPWVLFKLDGGIDHLLIDEAQDTNPDQWRVVEALAEEFFAGEGSRPGQRTLFVVGDDKQSIFSFQRADPAAFRSTREKMQRRIKAAANPWKDVDLDVSYRSVPAVLEMVDAVFRLERARDGVVADGVELTHFASRRGTGGLVELWPIVAPPKLPEEEPWSLPIVQGGLQSPETRLARTIAATIKGWLDRGERLEARGRAIDAGDVLILVRRRGKLFIELERALKAAQVPIAGVDRMQLTTQLAVMDLLALARFLLLPEDELTLATVLKSPLIGFDDDALFALAHGRKTGLWQALAAAGDPACLRAHAYLAGLLGVTDYDTPFALFSRVLAQPCPADPAGGRRALLARLGAEAEDALDELLALALAYQAREAPALQAFLHWFESGETEVKRELDQGDRGRVRIMTVHGAKGLEAPVVILPDTVAPLRADSQPILWPEEPDGIPLWVPLKEDQNQAAAALVAAARLRQAQEHRRLLYVALTRAADRLYICGHRSSREPPDDCWHALCRAALLTMKDVQRLEHPEFGEGALRLHWPATEIVPDREVARIGAATDLLPDWARRAPPPEPRPPRPLAPSRPSEAEPAVVSPLGPDRGRRFKRGLIVHQLLQTLPELAAAARPAAIRRYLARAEHGLLPLEQAGLEAEILAVLDHPEHHALFGSDSRAEVPVVGLIGEAETISGQVDRLVVTPEAVLIVDYKTNRPPPKTPAEVPAVYLRQMALYARALAAIYPGRAVRCLLLWTDGCRLMELPAELLRRDAP